MTSTTAREDTHGSSTSNLFQRMRYAAVGLFQFVERAQLVSHEFSAFFPLRELSAAEAAALQRTLKDSVDVLIRVPGVQSARWFLLEDPTALPSGTPRAAAGPLAFSFVFDGVLRDVLEELAASAGAQLDACLKQCIDYPGSSDLPKCVAYLRRHRAHSASQMREALRSDGREIQWAVALQAASRDTAPSPSYPFALSRVLETPIEFERLWVQRTAQLARARARRDARAHQRESDVRNRTALRGVHAKHHGLIEAKFRVAADVPEALRHGLFVPGAEYDCLLRLSNAEPRHRSDLKPDARGFAIKVLNAGRYGQSPALEHGVPDGLDLPAGHITQDFTLVSHPTFFLKDARDYAIFRSLVDARPEGRAEALQLAASLAAFALVRPKETLIFFQTLLRLTRQPLALEYHSMLPAACGPNRALKFSVRPSAETRARLRRETLADLRADMRGMPGRHLSHALQRTLDALGSEQLELEFVAHYSGEGSALPVEDPTIDWDKRGAERRVVAHLTFGKQPANSPERMARAEHLIITPWHALADHRPLGSLNRARLETYLASAQERKRANGLYAQTFGPEPESAPRPIERAPVPGMPPP